LQFAEKLDSALVFGWRSGSALRSASSFLMLALAAAGDCGAHAKFFSKPQSRSQGIQ
jgi:LPS sulfotransferase NodH